MNKDTLGFQGREEIKSSQMCQVQQLTMAKLKFLKMHLASNSMDS